jgi:hypothetical protein
MLDGRNGGIMKLLGLLFSMLVFIASAHAQPPSGKYVDPGSQIVKSFNATTTQTGTDVWDPASGKKIAVTHIQIGTYGTTAGRLILWCGSNADTTYTEGTDQALFKASFVPSATSAPGVVLPLFVSLFCNTADYEIHITTDAALSVDLVISGYEY